MKKSSEGIAITLTLDANDQPVLEFVHSEKDTSLEQKLLGSLIRNIGRQGLELHLVKHWADTAKKSNWRYHIRAVPPEGLNDPPPTVTDTLTYEDHETDD